MQLLRPTSVILASIAMLAPGADDPANDPDPWLGVSVHAKTGDVRTKDDQGIVAKKPLFRICVVVKVDGDRFSLRSFDGQPVGWVAKADVVRADDAEEFFTEQIRVKPTAFAFRSRGMLTRGEASIRDFSEAIRLDPSDALAFRFRAPRWDDQDRALADINEALRLSANDDDERIEILGLRASHILRNKEEGRALADFDEMLRVAGENQARRGEALRLRSLWLSFGVKTERALAGFDEALTAARENPKATVALLTARATFHDRQGHPDLALADLDEAVRSCNADMKMTFFHPLRLRALKLAEKGESDRAMADLDELIRVDPANTFAHVNKGDLLKTKGNIPAAIAAYSRGLSELPSAYGYQMRARAYAEMKDYDRAIHDYDLAIRIEGRNAISYVIERGVLRVDKGDFDGAIADFDEAIKKQPNSARAFLNRGRALHNQGEYDRAIADYSEAIRFNPKEKWGHYNRGSARQSSGDPGGAIADYAEAIRLDPQFARAYARRGYAYQAINSPDAAIADYERALELDPKQAGWVRPNIGDLKLAAKDYDGAIAAYTQHLNRVTPYAALYSQRALAWWRKNEIAKAVDDYDLALRIEPKNVSNLLNRANLLYYLGRHDDSLSALNTAVQLEPKNAQVHLGLARTLLKFDQREESLAACEEAIRLDPTLAEARYWRGWSRFGKGKWAESLSDYDEAVRLDPKIAIGHAGRALILATSSDVKVRDGKKAVEAATRACELSDGKVSVYIVALAEAQAEAGDFDAALKSLDKVEAMLPVGHRQRDLVIEVLRPLFLARKPFHMPPGGTADSPPLLPVKPD